MVDDAVFKQKGDDLVWCEVSCQQENREDVR